MNGFQGWAAWVRCLRRGPFGLGAFFLVLLAGHAAPPPIISVGQDGRLIYDLDERANRVPDFSHCGYAGGNRPIPNAPVRVVVAPASGDSTAHIQRALDWVGGLEPGSNGLRGAVLLLEGRHEVLGQLTLNKSGVVLRGQGVDKTVLVAAGRDRRSLLRLVGRDGRTTQTKAHWHLVEGYVPVGTTKLRLHDSSGLQAGERVRIVRPSTQKWMHRVSAGSSNPTPARARQLAELARQPAPQLAQYIARAAERDPIPADPGDAKSIEEIPASPKRSAPPERRSLVLTNGWLTVEGRLVVGGSTEVTWWRGNIRSSQAAAFGPAVTRFVPGRIGRGFTDDLEALAAELAADGQAALQHQHGLWYDRRRDDHQRVRRMDGDVWPPFYEQPFARSGQGVAWDGLSQYDLTRFNPWYWDRLREFAQLCERNGLVLFHQNYFQHNLLEAGAHWADSPWRSTNNVNQTDFPEPPLYAGDKRIFMAELFYDPDHPRRRPLHEAYIRQCLDNFRHCSNVIQFTGAEFTGPLPFMQFWLDTIEHWRQRTGSHPLVALSCTKDVQDAILADPDRAQLVDLIDLRYWWQTPAGLFAPPGGGNLAPRQFERAWRGGRPADADLAQMAATYRRRHPEKAIICNFDSAGWAFLCAGGSLPRLSRGVNPRLLAAIPRMGPWFSNAEESSWALCEPGESYLIFSGRGAELTLDLSGGRGRFSVHEVGLESGDLRSDERVEAGGVVRLKKRHSGRAVFWLNKDY